MQQNPNLIPRLVYDFLIKSGYNSTATTFATECPHLRGLKLYAEFSGATSLLSLSMSPNLFDIVESFFNFRDKKDLSQCSKSSNYSNAGRQPFSAIQCKFYIYYYFIVLYLFMFI
jgi:LisH